MKSVFEGCGVALVTPFKDKEIDFENLKKIIDDDLHKGAKAIVVLATTGEGTTISETEREQIIKFCRKLTFRKAKLIIGTGNNNFEVCKRYTKMAKKLGADAALVVTPYYNKTTQTGLVKYYQNLAKLKFPMIMYNVPSRTGLMIELDTVKKIIETNQYVYGIKESTTDIARISKLCEICKNKIAVYSGEDALNFVFYCLGGSFNFIFCFIKTFLVNNKGKSFRCFYRLQKDKCKGKECRYFSFRHNLCILSFLFC